MSFTHDEILNSKIGKYDKVKKSIEILMRHIGESNLKISKYMSKLTMNEMLSSACITGTERQKSGIQLPPDEEKNSVP